MDRREFLRYTATVAAATGATLHARGANDRVILGVVGINDRGMDLAEEFAKRKDTEVRYLADPDSRLFDARAKRISDIAGKAPKCVQDFRRILDDHEVNAIAIATPDHWHALTTILACQAGKDVYVEKPTSHSIWESRKMLEAARKYQRIVQVGTQNRSAEYLHEAVELIRSGALGDVHLVRVVNSKQREIMDKKPDTAPPKEVDYDLWLGPAPKRAFNESRFHYNWHWFWDYSGGDLINDGVHQLDIARWIVDRKLPKAVSSTGAIYALDDGRDTPDTQTVTWEFDGVTMLLEQALWTPYMRKTPLELRDKGALPNWPFNGTRVEVHGTKQLMCVGRMGDGWQLYNGEGNPSRAQQGQFAATFTKHAANFIDCIRSRQRPSADIEEGHYSTLLAHYGNIAYRTGRRLHVDAATEGFVNDTDANAYVRRQYREPWIVPESV